ncbi:hypothetical protein, partial [Thiolapillus sp.]|uniref:hypothetical protein n=1 Tax=Thiolapillus sp. TaxID=2017437 RepID=UPI003AF501B7
MKSTRKESRFFFPGKRFPERPLPFLAPPPARIALMLDPAHEKQIPRRAFANFPRGCISVFLDVYLSCVSKYHFGGG